MSRVGGDGNLATYILFITFKISLIHLYNVMKIYNIIVCKNNTAETQYKTGGNGNLRDGWSPDASKCKLMWERNESIEKPSFETPKTEVVESKSQWIGEVGKRLVVKGKIVFTKLIGYSEWGGKYITIVEDDAGNQIKAWKYLGEKDETVEIKGTVKEHDVHEGVKGTVLTRISILSAETV